MLVFRNFLRTYQMSDAFLWVIPIHVTNTDTRSIFKVVVLLPPFLTLNKYLTICLKNSLKININYLLDRLRCRKMPSRKKYLKLTKKTLELPRKFIFMLAIMIPFQDKKTNRDFYFS